MLSLSAPLPVGTALPIDAPSFYNVITAYGPASHAAFCTSPAFIEYFDNTVPTWREEGHTFAKLASGIGLEHAMKWIRSDYQDFGIASGARAKQAGALLERATERTMLRIADATFDPLPEQADKQRFENPAYKSVPLSKPLPLHRIIPGHLRDRLEVTE